MRHAPPARMLRGPRPLHWRGALSWCRLFSNHGRTRSFLGRCAWHHGRWLDDHRSWHRMTACLMWHASMSRLPLYRRGFFLSGNVLTDLPGSLLRHAFKSPHQNRLLDVLFDLGAPQAGPRGHRRHFHHGDRRGGVSAAMRVLAGRHLVGVHCLHLPLGHRPTTGLLHLTTGWSPLVDKRMAPAVAGHDLRHIHAVLEDRGLPRHRRINVDVRRAHKLVRVDESVAGRAEAVAGITVAVYAAERARLRRQGSPAHAITALAPCDPRRRPVAPRHPDPSMARQIHPAAIVVGSPAKGLVRLPCPAKR